MATSVAGLIAYAGARGTALADDAATASALVRATDYITHNYVTRFLEGYDASSPYVDDATYAAAILETATPGLFSKTYTPAEQKVLTKVDGIQWTVVGEKNGGAMGATPVSTVIEAMLRTYIDRGIAHLVV